MRKKFTMGLILMLLLAGEGFGQNKIDLTSSVIIGVLPQANGGLGPCVHPGALNSWNGTTWVCFDGNTSGTMVLQEDSGGNMSWVVNGSGSVTASGSPVSGNIPKFTSSTNIAPAVALDIANLFGCNSSTPLLNYLGGCASATGTGSVTSVAQTVPNFFAIGGSPITAAGTLAITYATGLTGNENQVLAVDGSGNAGLRALTFAMLPPIASAFTSTSWVSSGTMTWAIGSKSPLNTSIAATHNTTSTLNITGVVNGGNYVVTFLQDSTGTGTTTVNLGTGCTNWYVANSTDYAIAGSLTITPTANHADVLAFTSDGTNCWVSYH